MNIRNIESDIPLPTNVDVDSDSPESFLSGLSSDLQNIVENLPITSSTDESNADQKTTKKKKKVLPKLSRKKLVFLVKSIFLKIKSFNFILSTNKFSIIEKRFNACLMLNRLGADADSMSLSELNVVYDNFKGTLQSK